MLDAITDTKTGEQITPDELARRLAGTRLLLIGEEHTNADFHGVQLRVLQALVKSGRRVLIGLEMYPYTEQRFLDQWRDGLLTEEGFLRLSRWYDNWGYNWLYYRDIFLLARDHRVPMFAVNTPREVVAAVRKKGLANLTPEEAAHIPKDIDVDNADHMTFFRTTFEDEQGPVHGGGMGDDMWKNMLSAQCTWDATMGYNARPGAQAGERPEGHHGDPRRVRPRRLRPRHRAAGAQVVRRHDHLPHPGRRDDGEGRGRSRASAASYANFTWGVPEEVDSMFPTLGTSTAVGQGDTQRKVIIVQKGSAGGTGGRQGGRRHEVARRRVARRQGDVQPPDGGQAVGRHGGHRHQARRPEPDRHRRVPKNAARGVEITRQECKGARVQGCTVQGCTVQRCKGATVPLLSQLVVSCLQPTAYCQLPLSTRLGEGSAAARRASDAATAPCCTARAQHR